MSIKNSQKGNCDDCTTTFYRTLLSHFIIYDFYNELNMKKDNLKLFIEYRNMVISKRDARLKHGLVSISGKQDYYTIRLKEINKKFPEFKGIGKIKFK